MDVTIPYRFLARGGTAAAVAALNEVVKSRELVLETDTGRMKRGDGVTHYNSLPYIAAGDIDLTGLADGDALIWDAGAGQWVPTAPGDVAGDTHAATSKTTPVDADEIPLADSAASFGLKKLTWANLKATAKAYFDTLYQAIHANLTALSGLAGAADKLAYFTGLGTMALTAFPAFGRSLCGLANAAAGRTLLGITSGGAIGTSAQAFAKWDFWEHGIGTSTNTGASYVITTPSTGGGSIPVGYLSNGSLSLIAGEAGHPGIALCQTGNSAGGYCRVFFTPGNLFLLGGGEIRMVAVIRIPVLSTSSQRFDVSMALQNGITGVTRLMDLRVRDDINSGNWHMRCIDAGGTTTTNGATAAVANAWTRLELVINAAGTSVEGFVDGVSQGTATTNIPNADSMGFAISINKAVGATTSLLHIDYAEITQTFTTPR